MQKMAETTMRVADGGAYVVTCVKHKKVYQQWFWNYGSAYVAYKTHRSHTPYCSIKQL